MEKKSGKPFLGFIIILILILVFSFSIGETGFAKLLPDHMGFQIGYIFWMSAIASIIGTVFIGYVLGPLFLVAQKYTVGIRMTYGLQDRPKPEKLKIYFKALFPALMTLNLAFMFAFSPTVADIVVNPAWVARNPTTNSTQIPLVVLAILLPLMSGVSMGLFSPIWFLLDSGIVFTNKEKVKMTRDPIEVRSVGGWYHYILKGYAGISVIVSFFLFASNMIATFTTFNPSIILIILLPLLLVVMYVPAFVILEITTEHRTRFMRKIANKFGINQPLTNPLDIGKD